MVPQVRYPVCNVRTFRDTSDFENHTDMCDLSFLYGLYCIIKMANNYSEHVGAESRRSEQLRPRNGEQL